eukprot:gene36691-45260_t
MSLASASPQTIDYLKTLGDNGVIAEQQYTFIRSDPLLHQYYIAFNQAVSSAVLACQSINSGMVSDSRVSNSEQIMSYIDMVAGASGLPGCVSIATGICSFLVKLPNDALRAKSVSKVTTAFPSVDSHKFIEILSRELTILQQNEIRSIATSETVRRSAWEKIKRTVEWLQTLDNATAVQTFASSHASILLDKLMLTDPAVTVQHSDITRLIEWIVADRSVSVTDQLKAARKGDLTFAPSHIEQVGTVRVSSRTVANVVTVPVTNSAQFSPNETESLKAQLAAMEEREQVRDAEITALRQESEKQKRIAAALQKDVGKLSPKDNSTVGSGGKVHTMMPKPTSATSQGSKLDDKVHLHEARIEHANVAIGDIIVQLNEKDEIIAELSRKVAALENNSNKKR